MTVQRRLLLYLAVFLAAFAVMTQVGTVAQFAIIVALGVGGPILSERMTRSRNAGDRSEERSS